jgi:hypothetical protein
MKNPALNYQLPITKSAEISNYQLLSFLLGVSVEPGRFQSRLLLHTQLPCSRTSTHSCEIDTPYNRLRTTR